MADARTPRHLKPLSTFYATQQLADVLQLKPRTIQRWIDAGYLVAYRFGRKYRIKGEDVDHFLETYKLHAPAQMAAALRTDRPAARALAIDPAHEASEEALPVPPTLGMTPPKPPATRRTPRTSEGGREGGRRQHPHARAGETDSA